MKYALITFFVIVGSIFVMQKIGIFPSFSDFFKKEPVVVTETPAEEDEFSIYDYRDKEENVVQYEQYEPITYEEEGEPEETPSEEQENTQTPTQTTPPGEEHENPVEETPVQEPESEEELEVEVPEPIQSTDTCADLPEAEINDCYQNQAKQNNDPTYCEKITNVDSMSYQCFKYFVEKEKDYTYCFSILYSGGMLNFIDICVSDYAGKYDYSVCSAAYGDSGDELYLRDLCYDRVAHNVPDSSACMYISQQGTRELCLQSAQ